MSWVFYRKEGVGTDTNFAIQRVKRNLVSSIVIASVAYRLQVQMYTQNVKDFVPLLRANQVIKPY